MRTLILLLVLCISVSSLATERAPVESVRPLDAANITKIDLNSTRNDVDIQLGNLSALTNSVSDWYYGVENVAYPIKTSQAASCPGGFAPLSATIYLEFGPEDIPVTFEIKAGLRAADMTDPACVKPGDFLVESPTYEVTVEEADLYEFVLPFDVTDASCVNGDGPWFIDVDLPQWFDLFGDIKKPDALTDDNPTPCTSWYSFYNYGWEDLVTDYAWPGNIVLRMDAACCSNGVANEDRSWSDLKSSFR